MAVKVVKTLDDITLPESGFVNIKRGKSVLRIPIKAISLEEQERIEAEFEIPAPPKNFDRERKVYYADENDPLYQKQVRDISSKRVYATAIASMDIEIPGENFDEKAANLRKHFTVGDLALVIDAYSELSNVSEKEVEEVKNSLSPE